MSPINDNFADAIDLGSSVSGTVAGTLVGAGVEGAEPIPTNPGSALDATVWYGITAADDGVLELTTRDSATEDTVLAVYTGATLAGLVEAGSNDDGFALNDETWSRLMVPVSAGDHLWVQVATYPASTPDTFTLGWELLPPLVNDDFLNAIDLGTTRNGIRTLRNDAATVEPDDPFGWPLSVWWKWTAPSPDPVELVLETRGSRTIDGSPMDTEIGILSGGPTILDLSDEADNDDSVAHPPTSRVEFTTTPGETYWFEVATNDESYAGTLVFRWRSTPADIDFAVVQSAPRMGGIGLTDDGADFVDRISIDVIDPDDDPDVVLGTITDGAARTWLDEAQGTGSFSFQLQNRVATGDFPGSTPMVANPSLALALRRRWMRFNLDGEPAFTGYVEARRRTIRTQAREGKQVTVVSGRRWEAWTDKATVDAPGGFHNNGAGLIVGPTPLNKARRFNYTEPRFDIADWPFPTEVVRSDGQASPAWTGNPPGWPDPTSWWIGPPGMVAWPDPGAFGARTDYYWGLFIAPTTDTYTIYGTADDALLLSLLGTKLFDVDAGYGQMNKWQGTLEPGVLYTITAKVRNAAVATQNPTGLNVTIIRDRDGLVIFNTADNGLWRVLPNPTYEPGMTAGHVIQILDLEAQADGKLFGWTLGFDGFVDSAGRPWPVVNDIVLTIGNSTTQALARIGEGFADLRPNRAGGVLDAYVKGTAGRTRSVGFCDHPPEAANISELQVDELNERGTTVMFVWRSGSFKLSQPGYEPGGINDALDSEDYLELGEVDTLEAALSLAADYALIAGDPHLTVSVGFTPRGDADTPYKGFDVYDTLPVTAQNLDAAGDVNDTEWDSTEQIASVRVVQDDAGSKALRWSVELRDKWQDRDDRFTTLLGRVSPGGGGTTVNATSARPDDGLPTDVQAQVTAMGMPNGATGDTQGPVPVPGPGFLRQLVVRREDASGTTAVDLEVSGAVVATAILFAGQYLGRAFPTSVTPVATHLDWFKAHITTGNFSPTVALAVVELNTQH